MNRKTFLLTGGLAVLGGALGMPRLFAQADISQALAGIPDFPDHDPRHDPALVKKFVVAGHGNLAAVKQILAGYPTIVNGTHDWGNGDFETALGGASHMGRPDIAEFLLEHNARMDIFAATMLGKLEIVKAAVAAYPNIINVPGPHKIPLIAHAEKGGERAVAVLEFLRSVKPA